MAKIKTIFLGQMVVVRYHLSQDMSNKTTLFNNYITLKSEIYLHLYLFTPNEDCKNVTQKKPQLNQAMQLPKAVPIAEWSCSAGPGSYLPKAVPHPFTLQSRMLFPLPIKMMDRYQIGKGALLILCSFILNSPLCFLFYY